MSTYNPDAPQPNTGNWLQHTYQPQQNDSFYWGGSFGNSFGPNMGYNDGSRRNTPINPVNPFGTQGPNPFNTFGQVNPNTQAGIPETAVQPFSSYPPSTPQPGMGLNGLVESRRNTPLPTAPQSNPWATQPTVPQFTPQAPQMSWNQPQVNPFDPYACQGPGNALPMNTVALYNNNNQFGFDKRNSWENCYTQYRPLQTPAGNWNNQNNQFGYNQYQQSAVQYPNMNQIPTSQQSWKDIAIKNWDMVK
jgi:hypothetical protein